MPGVAGKAACGRPHSKFRYKPGLADSGFPADRDRHAAAMLAHGFEQAAELAKLRVTPYERPLLGIARVHPADLPHSQRLVETLDRDLTKRLCVYRPRRRTKQRLRDKRLPGLRDLVKPRGQIDRVTGD